MKLKVEVTDASSKSLQRRIRLDVMDEVVTIVDLNPYCAGKHFT